MKKKLYSVKDNVAVSFHTPFTSENTVTAMRSFSQAVQNPEGVMSKYPAEFDLCMVGEFDDETGDLIPMVPVVLLNGVSAIAKKE